jgi:hypothetical protein
MKFSRKIGAVSISNRRHTLDHIGACTNPKLNNNKPWQAQALSHQDHSQRLLYELVAVYWQVTYGSSRLSGTNRLGHRQSLVMTRTTSHENPHDSDAGKDKGDLLGIVSSLLLATWAFFVYHSSATAKANKKKPSCKHVSP